MQFLSTTYADAPTHLHADPRRPFGDEVHAALGGLRMAAELGLVHEALDAGRHTM